MNQKTQKFISALLICFAVFGGFEILVYMLYLNQPTAYWHVAFWIFLYLIFNVVFLFDLHFKKSGSWHRATIKHQSVSFFLHRNIRVLFSAFWDRFEHLRRWRYFTQWMHFLLIPTFIFWATVCLFYVNFSFIRIQQTVLILSGVALVGYYWYLKEAFYRHKEIIDSDIFIVLTVIKIYTAGLLYAASLSMQRYFCLPAWYFSTEVFCYTFLLIYQAIYQHRLVNKRNIFASLLISLIMAILGQLIYLHWAYNYFTAAVFMTAAYNLLWGVFHYMLDRALTKHAFLEIFFVSLLVAAMVMSVTNFNAKIFDGCNYTLVEIRQNNLKL